VTDLVTSSLGWIPVLWIGGWLTVSAIYRRGSGKPIIPRAPSDAVFHENWCSGRSLRNWLTRIGGARNCLMVYVHRNELIVTPKFPFTLMFLPEIYGLEVRVPLSAITSVVPTRVLFGRALRIAFVEGGPPPLELRLREKDSFIRHLGKGVAVNGPGMPSASHKLRKSYLFGFLRVFIAVWGIGAFLAGVSGLLGDYRYRRDGVEISGVFDGHSGVAGQRNDMGILSFSVADHQYHLTSLRGNGIYTIGDTERLFYMPGDPNQAREADSLGFDLLWLGLGLLALTLSIFGGRIARRLS
jgi:hypothetical protein